MILNLIFTFYCIVVQLLFSYPHYIYSGTLMGMASSGYILREFCVVLFGQICVRFRRVMVFVPHVYESNVGSLCKAGMG